MSLDSLDKSRRYAEEHQLRYPMATFPTMKLKRLYRANLVPFAVGEPHRDRLARDGPLPLDAAVRLGIEIADALAYAHQRG